MLESPNGDIDLRSLELITEFERHYVDFQRQRPDLAVADRRIVFEGWAIQKIAGLQVMLQCAMQRLESLHAQEMSRLS